MTTPKWKRLIQQDETSFNTFITQLDSMTWPTSTTQQDAAALAQTLTDERDAVTQEYNDLLDGQVTTQDNNVISAAAL